LQADGHVNFTSRLLVMVGYGQHVSRQAEEERMTTPGNADGHVQHDLGLYVLGALPQVERVAVEEHLRRCAACRAECAELEQVPAYLGLLSLAEVDGLASTRPEPEVTAPASVPRSRPGTAGA
jgi:anti-sigma factor RsiW